eukprot:m.75433 g.75433  ORF g.75433 m.75433 type:complete len:870 (-) comp14481_c0_seq3:95-2704(-)
MALREGASAAGGLGAETDNTGSGPNADQATPAQRTSGGTTDGQGTATAVTGVVETNLDKAADVKAAGYEGTFGFTEVDAGDHAAFDDVVAYQPEPVPRAASNRRNHTSNNLQVSEPVHGVALMEGAVLRRPSLRRNDTSVPGSRGSPKSPPRPQREPSTVSDASSRFADARREPTILVAAPVVAGTPEDVRAAAALATTALATEGGSVPPNPHGHNRYTCVAWCCRSCTRGLGQFGLWVMALAIKAGVSLSILGALTAIGYITATEYEDHTISGASIAAWCCFLGTGVVLWLLAEVVVWAVCSVLESALPFVAGRTYRQTVLLRAFRFAARYLLWAILFLISFQVVFHVINPFPAEDSNGADRELSQEAGWIARLLGVNIVLAVLLILRRWVLVSAALERKTFAFNDQIQDTLRAGLVLRTLTKTADPSMFSATWEGDYRRRRSPPLFQQLHSAIRFRSFLGEIMSDESGSTPKRHDSARNPAPEYQKPEKHKEVDSRSTNSEPDEFEEDDLQHKHLNADFVQNNFLTVCYDEIELQSSSAAVRLGDVLHATFADKESGLVHVERFWKTCNYDKELYFSCLEMLDPNETKKLDKTQLQERCLALYRDRRNLARSLSDLDSIIIALGSFLNGGIVFVLLFAFIVVFNEGQIADLVVSLTTTFFALSFVFADTAKNFFNSFIFLFIRKPYDVGDRVTISEAYETMYVVRLELLTTTFRIWDGRIKTIPNYCLHSREIVNYRRSKNMTDSFELHIDYRTPASKIDELRDEFLAFCASNPNDYIAEDCKIFVRELCDSNSLKLFVATAQVGNFQTGAHFPRRSATIMFIKSVCERLDISYSPPVLRHVIGDRAIEGFGFRNEAGADPVLPFDV